MKRFKDFLIEVEDDRLLRRFARRQGVGLEIYTEPGPSFKADWYVDSIYRKKHGKKGAGKKVMKAISKRADKKNVSVGLHPGHPRLNRFYSELGYEKDRSSKTELMVRKPTKKDGR